MPTTITIEGDVAARLDEYRRTVHGRREAARPEPQRRDEAADFRGAHAALQYAARAEDDAASMLAMVVSSAVDRAEGA